MMRRLKIAFFCALALHVLVLGFVLIKMDFHKTKRPQLVQDNKPVPVKAVTVNQQKVENQIRAFKRAELDRKQAENSRLKQLQEQADNAKRMKLAEDEKIKQLQQQALVVQKKVKAEAARVKQLQQRALAAKKKVQAEAAKVKQLQQRALAAKKKTQAEAAKVKQLQQHALAAKKKAQAEKQRLAAMTVKGKAQEKQQKAAAQKAQQKLAKVKQQQTQEGQRLAKLAKERQAKELEQRLRAEEDELLSRQMAAEKRQLDAARRKIIQTEVEKYTALISHAIGQRWILPDNIDRQVSCILLIKLAPGGAVLDVKLVKSSGDEVLDRSATAAVFKASPLPVPGNTDVFNAFREIRLRVRPEGYLS